MSSPGTLVFSHANGFPAGTYRVLFDAWREAGWRVEAIERFGHDPRYPVTNNWPQLRAQLIDFVAGLNAGPVALVGHSLGGFLSLLATCARPDLVSSLVMLDSPVIAGWRAHSVQMIKATRLIGRVSPAKLSKSRRYHWGSTEEVHRHFVNKSVFSRWDARVLADYVRAGFEPADDGGVRLAFDRSIETRIYNTIPHNMHRLIHKHPPQCPVHFLAGKRSVEIRQVGMAATRALTRNRISWVDGSHLFPMEHPDWTANRVLEALSATPLPR